LNASFANLNYLRYETTQSKERKQDRKINHFFAQQCSLVHSHERNIFYTIL